MVNFYYLLRCLECGHFCINYLLKKDKIKRKVVYNRQMMSFYLVKKVLEEYYKVTCFRCGDISQIKQRCLTLVRVKNKWLHYVVIERVSEDYVYYYNPAFLNIKKSKKSSFLKKWAYVGCFCEKK